MSFNSSFKSNFASNLIWFWFKFFCVFIFKFQFWTHGLWVLTLTKLLSFDSFLNINSAPSTRLLFIVCSFIHWTKWGLSFLASSSSFLTCHWMSILVCKVKVFVFSLFFFALMSWIIVDDVGPRRAWCRFCTLKFVIWLLCFALCTPCVFVCLASVASKDYGAYHHLLNQKAWHSQNLH